MHRFIDLVDFSTSFTLRALNELNEKTNQELQVGASTISVKTLQMIQLQKAFLAIGMFSFFESLLQDKYSCRYGFDEAKKALLKLGKKELHDRFNDFYCAINVLKHGKGNSYNTLISKHESLPFKVKLPENAYFFEGDVSEIESLIYVDDKFVLDVANLVELVYKEIEA